MSYIIKNIIPETKTPLTSRSFAYNPRGKIVEILQRLSEKETTISPTLMKLKEKHRQSYILNLKNFNEADLNEIKQDMNTREKNLISQINDFKKGTIEFEQNKKKIFNSFQKITKENFYFSLLYKQFKKNSIKTGENELMKNDDFFKIANTYLLKNIRLPDLSRNVFNSNPLILDNDHIKQFFIYNKHVDSKKFLDFLDRLKEILGRKILGNYKLSQEEKKHLEELKKQEKPKGYIPPEVLIPSLQEDISKTQLTYDCLMNEYNNKNKTSNDSNISNFNNSISSINNNSQKSIFQKKNKIYDIKKLLIKKMHYINSGKNSRSIDSFINNNNNNSSLDTTSVPLDTKKNNNNSIINSNSMINIKSSVNNIFNRRKTHTMAVLSPIRHRLKSNTARVIKYFNKDLDKSNNNKIIHELNPPNEQSKEINNIFLKKSFNSGIKSKFDNSLMEKEINNTSMIQGNKLELFTPKKKIDFFNLINEHAHEQETSQEKNKHSSFKNIKGLFSSSPNNCSEDLKSQSKNDESNQIPNNLKSISRHDSFQNQMPIIIEKSTKSQQKSDSEKNQEPNIENLYNKALHLTSKSLKDEVDLENYLLSIRREKNLNEIITLKNTYYNILKMEKSFNKNIIKKEYNFRIKNAIQGRFLNEQQNKVLNKSDKFNSIFLRNANVFRKVICEKDKDNFD